MRKVTRILAPILVLGLLVGAIYLVRLNDSVYRQPMG